MWNSPQLVAALLRRVREHEARVRLDVDRLDRIHLDGDLHVTSRAARERLGLS